MNREPNSPEDTKVPPNASLPKSHRRDCSGSDLEQRLRLTPTPSLDLEDEEPLSKIGRAPHAIKRLAQTIGGHRLLRDSAAMNERLDLGSPPPSLFMRAKRALHSPYPEKTRSPGRETNESYEVSSVGFSLWSWMSGAGATLSSERPKSHAEDEYEHPLSISPPVRGADDVKPHVRSSERGPHTLTLNSSEAVVASPGTLDEPDSAGSAGDALSWSHKARRVSLDVLPHRLRTPLASFDQSGSDMDSAVPSVSSMGIRQSIELSKLLDLSTYASTHHDTPSPLYAGRLEYLLSLLDSASKNGSEDGDHDMSTSSLQSLLSLALVISMYDSKTFHCCWQYMWQRYKLCFEAFEDKISSTPKRGASISYLLFRFLDEKDNFFTRTQPVFAENYSIERFLRASAIEAVDDVRRSQNNVYRSRIYCSKTIQQVRRLAQKLRDIIHIITEGATLDSIHLLGLSISSNGRLTRKESKHSLSSDMGYDAMTETDLRTRPPPTIDTNSVTYYFVVEALHVITAALALVSHPDSEPFRADAVELLATVRSLFLDLQELLLSDHGPGHSRNVALQEAVSVNADGSEITVNLRFMIGRPYMVRVSNEILNVSQDNPQAPSEFPKPYVRGGVQCSFTGFSSMHQAVAKEIHNACAAHTSPSGETTKGSYKGQL